MGNPNAHNASGASGLVQVMPGTFKEYALAGYNQNIYEPLSNLLAGMNYSIHHYGSVQGGFDRPGSYDNGGWLMPGQLFMNYSRKPEPILSGEQWPIAKAAIEKATAKGSGVNVGPITINVQSLDGTLSPQAERQLTDTMYHIFNPRSSACCDLRRRGHQGRA